LIYFTSNGHVFKLNTKMEIQTIDVPAETEFILTDTFLENAISTSCKLYSALEFGPESKFGVPFLDVPMASKSKGALEFEPESKFEAPLLDVPMASKSKGANVSEQYTCFLNMLHTGSFGTSSENVKFQSLVDLNLVQYIVHKSLRDDVTTHLRHNLKIPQVTKNILLSALQKAGIYDSPAEFSYRVVDNDFGDQEIGFMTLAKMILNGNVSPNFQTKRGNIFHIYVNGQYFDDHGPILRQLLDCGCDIYAKDANNQSPFELTRKMSNTRISKIIRFVIDYEKEQRDGLVPVKEKTNTCISIVIIVVAVCGGTFLLSEYWDNIKQLIFKN